MKLCVSIALGLTALSLTLAACAQQASEGETLQFGHNSPADSPTGEAAERLAELANEKTDGGLTIEVFPSNQLGGNEELIDQTSSGSTDMSAAGLGVLGFRADEYQLLQAPFLFENQEHIHNVVEGDLGEDLANQLQEDIGMLLLSQTWDRLPRQITGAREVTEPEDLNNFLLRTGSSGATETFSLFGASPTSIPLDDMYIALQQGTVEGVEVPADYVADQSLNEVTSHISMLDHTYGTQFVGINADRFDGLPEEYQTALEEAVAEAGEYNNDLIEESETEIVNELRETEITVVEVSDDQRQEFVEVVLQNLEELESNWPGAEGVGEEILNQQE